MRIKWVSDPIHIFDQFVLLCFTDDLTIFTIVLIFRYPYLYSKYCWYSWYCADSVRSLRKATAGWRTSPESGRYTILAGWRLSARLSLIWYTFFASSMFAQSVPRCALLSLCLKSWLQLWKIRKQSLFVHLNPMRQDELENALLISNDSTVTTNLNTSIPSNINSCNGVKRRRPQMHHSQRFLELKFTLFELRNQRHWHWHRDSWYKSQADINLVS